MSVTQPRTQFASPDALESVLLQIAARLRAVRRQRFAVRGLLVALTTDVVCAFLMRLGLLPDGPFFLLALLCVAGLGAGAGALLAARQPVPLMEAARLAESRLSLKERLSSALEFEKVSSPNVLVALQHQDAETHARALQPDQAVPRRLPREAWGALPLLLLLAVTLWLPALPFAEAPAARADRLAVQQAGDNLVKSARVLEKRAEVQHQPRARAAAQKMEKLGEHMQNGHMTKPQAMAALSRQEQEMAEQQAGQSPESDPGAASRSLADDGKQSASSPEPQSDPAALKRELEQQSGQAAGRKPDAAGLRRLADALRRTPYSETQKHVQDAADAAQHGDSSQAAAALRQAAESAKRETGKTPDTQGAQSDARQALDNARRQLAQDGQPAGAQSGKSPTDSRKPGQSSGQSQGQSLGQSGKGNTPGQGQGAQQSAPQAGSPSGMPAPGGGGNSENKFPLGRPLPPTPNSKAPTLYLGAPKPGSATLQIAPQTGHPGIAPPVSRVPYQKALPAYRRGAEAAMDHDNIPPSQRAAVRDYFNSLQSAKP